MRNSLITTIAIAMVLSVALPALAVPVHVPLQGVLRDNAGAPVSQGEFELTFTLYSDEGGETSVWTETRLVTVSGGIFRLSLGEVEALAPATVAASAGLWLGVQVETDPELPLRPLGSTPYAMVASNLACTGCITPEALSQSAVESIRGDILQTLATDGYATHAGELAIDGDSAGLAAQDVQSAVAELKALIDNQSSSTNVNEGAGAVRTYSNQWGLPSYGVAKDYVHIINPNPPKVQLYL